MSRSALKWYAASIIMYFKFNQKNQRSFPVWENVLLVRAKTPEQAKVKAAQLAKLEEGPAEEAVVLFGRPARRVFAGVRKVVTCAPAVRGPRRISQGLEDGGEATFSTFVVRGEEGLLALASGKSVRVLYQK